VTGRFEGAAAFVTGAGSGIGRACAERLVAEGASVLCFDLDGAAATGTAQALGPEWSVAVQGDVRDREAISQALAVCEERFGKVTHLVNAAGVTAHAGLFEITEEEWNRVLGVNLKGTFLVTQVVAPGIARAGGGAVVNISSIESEVVFASSDRYQPNYGASKGGVTMLTKGLAYELAPLGIRVNAVAPALVATPMLLEHLGLERAQELIAPKTMLKRLAQPEEVGAAVAFLLSGDASYITGVQLPVDGGWLAM
jgi:NAD(P)-dependent dehydrogenase (short-subunit alcohol dehydrogenase family)